MKRLFAAAAVACLLAGCQTTLNNPTAWGQIAAGVGAIVGETKIDPQIAQISTKLATYCGTVQTAALAIDILAPAKAQKAAQEAKIVVATFCAAPPSNVASAIASLVSAYSAIDAARRAP
jgi:hypothetical protein